MNYLEIINGTTLRIPYDEEIHNLIKSNFTEDRKSLLYHERFDVIFGRFNTTIKLVDYIEIDIEVWIHGQEVNLKIFWKVIGTC